MSHSPTAAINHPFDAVTLEILWRRTISAVDEAAKALRRTSFSTLVNESNDFACVLTDAAGQSLAQNTESIPSFIGTLPVTVKEFIKQIGLGLNERRTRPVPLAGSGVLSASPALVMSCRARTRHTYDGTRRGGRMTSWVRTRG